MPMRVRPFRQEFFDDGVEVVGTIGESGFTIQVDGLEIAVPTVMADVDESGPFAYVEEGTVTLSKGLALEIAENEPLPGDPPNGMWLHELALLHEDGRFHVFFDGDGKVIGSTRVRRAGDSEGEDVA